MANSKDSLPVENRVRFEPWPWALGSLLAAMIIISVSFLIIATIHPDADVRVGEGTPRAAAATAPPAEVPDVPVSR